MTNKSFSESVAAAAIEAAPANRILAQQPETVTIKISKSSAKYLQELLWLEDTLDDAKMFDMDYHLAELQQALKGKV